jgi:hypothetical protein
LERPLPEGLSRAELEQVRMIVYGILHLLDLTLDESLPLIGRLVKIDRRLAVAVRLKPPRSAPPAVRAVAVVRFGY